MPNSISTNQSMALIKKTKEQQQKKAVELFNQIKDKHKILDKDNTISTSLSQENYQLFQADESYSLEDQRLISLLSILDQDDTSAVQYKTEINEIKKLLNQSTSEVIKKTERKLNEFKRKQSLALMPPPPPPPPTIKKPTSQGNIVNEKPSLKLANISGDGHCGANAIKIAFNKTETTQQVREQIIEKCDLVLQLHIHKNTSNFTEFRETLKQLFNNNFENYSFNNSNASNNILLSNSQQPTSFDDLNINTKAHCESILNNFVLSTSGDSSIFYQRWSNEEVNKDNYKEILSKNSIYLDKQELDIYLFTKGYRFNKAIQHNNPLGIIYEYQNKNGDITKLFLQGATLGEHIKNAHWTVIEE
jgi:hypothetical protein